MEDHRQNLQNYISQQLSAGQSPDHIDAQLRSTGWPEAEIHHAFRAVQAQMVPASLAQQQESHTANSPTADGPKATGKKRGRIRTGWQLLKQSWLVLKGNPYLLRYMVMTGVWALALNIIFVGIYITFYDQLTQNDYEQSSNLAGLVVVFLDYLLIYFFVNLYAAGLTANVLDIFQGNRQPYGSYMHIAWSKAPSILVFSAISATVGMILQFIVERIRWVGWILSWLLGTLWSLGTMFVVPIIVTSEHPSGARSIKQSVKFFKQTWGENVVAKVGVNAPLFLMQLAIIGIFLPLLFVVAAVFHSVVAVIILIVLYILASFAVAVIGSFANSIINIALFYYATQHTVPPAFSADLLNQVFVNRKRSRLGKKLPAQA